MRFAAIITSALLVIADAQADSGFMNVMSARNAVVTVLAQQYQTDGSRLLLNENSGAGVIIDAVGYVVTNTHVIYGSNLIKIILNDNSQAIAHVAFVSREYDFSILKISTAAPLPAVTWPASNNTKLGDEIITIGHSPLLNQTISGGQISGMGTRTLENGQTSPELLQLSINHYNGDSGGPVFNEAGFFMGLISSKRLAKQRAALAIPGEKIHAALNNLIDQPKD